MLIIGTNFGKPTLSQRLMIHFRRKRRRRRGRGREKKLGKEREAKGDGDGKGRRSVNMYKMGTAENR